MNFKLKFPKIISSAVLSAALLAVGPMAYADVQTVRNASSAAADQTKKISGTVVDENGDPLVGASILLKAGTGVITDIDGHFSMDNVPVGSTLKVSYLGYQDAIIKVGNSQTYTVKMVPDSKYIDEVVVVGYGVQKKSNVTGSIASMKADDLKNSVITNAGAALQGKASGVQVINSSNAPGASPTIRVRGYSSNGTSDPLFIVDGLKVSDISYLDPNSIESMEILKDAASAAIYGAEAGNGVILITTKMGKKDKTSITFDAQWSYSSLAKKVDVMNADEYSKFYTEGLGDGFTSLYNMYNISGTDTDWQDEMYETGQMQKYNISISAGNDKGSFYVGGGYVNNDGMIRLDNDFYKRINGQINATYKVRPWLEVGTSNTIVASNGASLSESDKNGTQLSGIIMEDPLTPVFYTSSNIPSRVQGMISNGLHVLQNADGQYYGLSYMQDNINPLGSVYADRIENRVSSINGSTYANITPFKNFVFTSRLGYTIGNVSQDEYVPTRVTGFFKDADTQLRLLSGQYTTRYYQWENFANYTLETKTAGDFSVMAGMSYSDYSQRSASGLTNDLSNEASNFRYLDYSTNSADDYVSGHTHEKRQIAYYGRLTWDYLDRYNFQVNFRADSYDSAYLDLDHNWGYFPSFSAGWTFTNEDFMKDITASEVLTFGKIRASWGVNGSISNLGNYMYAATLRSGMFDQSSQIGNMTYYMDGNLVTGIYPNSTLANPKLRWERSKQFDLGLDLRFFRDRLTIDADYYHKLTDGLLIQSVAPLVTGASTVYQNVGKVVNDGFELELGWKDHIGDFAYSIKGNLSTVKNNVKEYKGEGTRIEGSNIKGLSSANTYFEEGYPLWYIRGYKLQGIDQQTGEAIYEDLNNDGQINDADRTSLGKGIPDLTYGFTLNMAWKGIDFLVYGTGATGYQLVYGLIDADPASRTNRAQFLYDGRWTSNTTQAKYPSAVYQINDSRFYQSDALVYDASYFKIKQIQLGYTLPKSLLRKTGFLESLRIYCSLDNFFTFTSYPGSDPEANASSQSASGIAIDFGGYPMAKSVSFGFNLGF